MANPIPGNNVSAVQVGAYFVGQYYQVLQQQPDFVYQFYTDASTMLRVDGDASKKATAMLQIHSVILSLNFTAIEIKSAHSLDSWNGGVVVMVSGSVQIKDYDGRRKFVQTFFLAPQEKGYFVLNDIFHFLDDEQIHQHPVAILAQGDFESEVNAPDQLPEPVPDYMIGEEQAKEFVASAQVEENDTVDKYSIPDQPQHVPEVDTFTEETPAPEESTNSFPAAINNVRDHAPVVVVEESVIEPQKRTYESVVEPQKRTYESVVEPQKHTYASILRVAKGQPGPSVAPQASFNKGAAPIASEWHYPPQPNLQQSNPVSSTAPERSAAEAADETATPEEGEGTSVYVRNLPSTISTSDVEQEFKNFGRIKAEGVVIRNRKDIGVCYAFIEFEDAYGVQNAIKASPIQFGGRQVYIEERRANSSSSRSGRRGRGRGGYQSDAPRGRFGPRTFGRGSGQESGDRDYSNRPRGNGYHQRGQRQERGVLTSPVSRNGSYPSESSS